MLIIVFIGCIEVGLETEDMFGYKGIQSRSASFIFMENLHIQSNVVTYVYRIQKKVVNQVIELSVVAN